MSILSGILSGGELAAELGRAVIDSSHHPFKRAATRPGGPAGRKDKAINKWVCDWEAPYIQKCKNTKTGKKKTVKVNADYKHLYNKVYRSEKFPKGKAFSRSKARPGAKYRKDSAWLKFKRAAKRSKKK